MPELALALWLLYGAGALGTRVAIHLHRTGSTGLVGARARPGSAPWLAEVGHVVALGLGIAAPILAITETVPPLDALDRGAVHGIGLVLYAGGLGGILLGQAQMGESWRIGTDPEERTTLVTDGLFALVRNPIYSGVTVTLLGLALLVPSVPALASVALFIASVEVETRVIEEPHLRRTHGSAYEDYAAAVGRFVPGVGRLTRRRSEPRAPR